jgi:hypothetical protein
MQAPRHRHIAFGLLAYFYKEFIVLAFLILVKVVVGFAGPLGINRLLTYIETNGEGAIVRPWVWISWLFIGPLVGSAAMQWYIFINTGTLVRIECIITQLVFEHSLRIRMKEEAPATPERVSEVTTAVATPEQEADANLGEGNISHGATVGPTPSTSTSPSAQPKAKDKAKKGTSVAPSITPSTTASAKDKDKQGNLVGKINNFISTDLGNITGARDFLFMVWYCPLQIAICVWFLYSILGVAYVFEALLERDKR